MRTNRIKGLNSVHPCTRHTVLHQEELHLTAEVNDGHIGGKKRIFLTSHFVNCQSSITG